MISNSINLKWRKLERGSEIEFPAEKKYGVYLWGFTIEKEFIPYYVGIADNIFLRIIEHLNSIIGGKYVIYHRDSLKDFAKYKNQKINIKKTSGKIYTPNWPRDYKKFIENRKDYQPHIDFMVDCFTFSYATVDNEICKKDLKEIEKICINQIGKENLQNIRSGPSKRFKIYHSGEKKIIEIMKQQTANNGL